MTLPGTPGFEIHISDISADARNNGNIVALNLPIVLGVCCCVIGSPVDIDTATIDASRYIFGTSNNPPLVIGNPIGNPYISDTNAIYSSSSNDIELDYNCCDSICNGIECFMTCVCLCSLPRGWYYGESGWYRYNR